MCCFSSGDNKFKLQIFDAVVDLIAHSPITGIFFHCMWLIQSCWILDINSFILRLMLSKLVLSTLFCWWYWPHLFLKWQSISFRSPGSSLMISQSLIAQKRKFAFRYRIIVRCSKLFYWLIWEQLVQQDE